MEPNTTHNAILGHIDHMKPESLVPGVDILVGAVDEDTLGVLVVPTGVKALIKYNHGQDLYEVAIEREGKIDRLDGVYCDQLGELLFASDAKAWTQPFGGIITVNPETGEIEEVTF